MESKGAKESEIKGEARGETNLKGLMDKLAEDVKAFKSEAQNLGFDQFLNLVFPKDEILSGFTMGNFQKNQVPLTKNEFPSYSNVCPTTCEVPNEGSVNLAVRELLERFLKNEQEGRLLDQEIDMLDSKNKKIFWAMYHGIPLNETSVKLDTLISSVSTLNNNLEKIDCQERLDDILTEVQILRKEIRK